MSINILAPCYDKQVEAFFAGRDFFSFVAQNEEDMEQFLREVGTLVAYTKRTIFALQKYYCALSVNLGRNKSAWRGRLYLRFH